MKQRNDWQAFYRRQVKAAGKLAGNLHRLSELLPPRKPLSQARKVENKLPTNELPYVAGENSSLGDPSQYEGHEHHLLVSPKLNDPSNL